MYTIEYDLGCTYTATNIRTVDIYPRFQYRNVVFLWVSVAALLDLIISIVPRCRTDSDVKEIPWVPVPKISYIKLISSLIQALSFSKLNSSCRKCFQSKTLDPYLIFLVLNFLQLLLSSEISGSENLISVFFLIKKKYDRTGTPGISLKVEKNFASGSRKPWFLDVSACFWSL